MKMDAEIPKTMLAPCGLNCYACYAHVRTQDRCQGCRSDATTLPKHCLQCAIKNCSLQMNVDFCVDCTHFPCMRLKRLNKRYRETYQTDLIESMIRFRAIGAEAYLAEERAKYTCPHCGGVVSLHSKVCSECGEKI